MVLSTAVLVLPTKTFPLPAIDQSSLAMDVTSSFVSFNLITLDGTLVPSSRIGTPPWASLSILDIVVAHAERKSGNTSRLCEVPDG